MHRPSRHALDVHKMEPDKIPAWKGSGHDVPPLTKKLLETDSCWEREMGFLQWSGTFLGGPSAQE